jgi:hypothetical protein
MEKRRMAAVLKKLGAGAGVHDGEKKMKEIN